MNDDKTASQSINSGDKADKAKETSIEQDVAETPDTGEVGGPKGPEPTRYGDWEKKGRCIDF